jgi:large subunit ribosomal protein L5
MIIPLMEKYKNEAIPKMMEKFGYKNRMAVPKIEKVVVNTGFGRQIAGKTGDEQQKFADSIIEDLTMICGQKAVKTVAKKSIASFKIRKGMILGAKVTLRGKKMIDFLERLIHLALPRTRDFQGISPKAVDNQGNLTVAVKEHITFPEVLPEKAKNIFGLEITVVSSAKTREEGLELFRLLGFPIKSE